MVAGAPSRDLLAMAGEGLRNNLRAAIQQAYPCMRRQPIVLSQSSALPRSGMVTSSR